MAWKVEGKQCPNLQHSDKKRQTGGPVASHGA